MFGQSPAAGSLRFVGKPRDLMEGNSTGCCSIGTVVGMYGTPGDKGAKALSSCDESQDEFPFSHQSMLKEGSEGSVM